MLSQLGSGTFRRPSSVGPLRARRGLSVPPPTQQGVLSCAWLMPRISRRKGFCPARRRVSHNAVHTDPVGSADLVLVWTIGVWTIGSTQVIYFPCQRHLSSSGRYQACSTPSPGFPCHFDSRLSFQDTAPCPYCLSWRFLQELMSLSL